MSDLSDGSGHHEEMDMYPELPLVESAENSPSWWSRITGALFGERASTPALWYPGADRRFSMRTKGTYANNYPMGAVVHSTEGRSKNGDRDAENTIEGTGVPRGHCYFCISSTGKVYQSFPLDRWGVHCGQTYQSALGFNLDNKLVGIEVCAAGVVKKVGSSYKPDWNETFTEAEVRYSNKVENIQKAGFYHRFNEAQEKALFDLLLWIHSNNSAVFKLEYVFGHDEIATIAPRGSPDDRTLGRKQDPGASLSVYMKDFRQKLLAASLTS
ncbi:N-acetylmuramoyl-L-alanine amidase [Bradyrhizobium neotropicale]|uniref:peptidoglycan recognition protein family protein n=1 Tax=Bradyrhizobium neotropicale TaxID=1497615 RepID=UPI001AD72DBB|nr:N-acetylmuramoyl-L-alanine amidase [Bradyrhizobium neotropicale]MBO4223475.1 hypothetical protein [Bradyrhizobium neotropicale]